MKIEELLKAVKDEVGDRRIQHIKGTCQKAEQLADIFMRDEKENLKIAACLHDITKHFSNEEHISYAKKMKIELPYDYLASPKTLHELTGAYRARELFGNLVSDSVFLSIRYHTTGREDMTLPEKLIYLADYIEETRTFSDCVKLREYFNTEILKARDYSERLQVLDKTLLYSFDMTLCDLIKQGCPIHKETMLARNYLIESLKGARPY